MIVSAFAASSTAFVCLGFAVLIGSIKLRTPITPDSSVVSCTRRDESATGVACG
jgi:hypothetical protein